MTDLNTIIGDERLGDIQLPGSHDAGTVGIDENSDLVDRNFFYQAADVVAPQAVVGFCSHGRWNSSMQIGVWKL